MGGYDVSRFTRRMTARLAEGSDVKIVTFGDSITAGYAVSRGFDHFWKEMLKEKYPETKVDLINSGICGETSLDGLYRLDQSVIAHRPDLVTVNFGINDMYFGLGLDQFKSNIIEIVDRSIEMCGCEVLLLGSEPLLTAYYRDQVLDYYGVLEDVAEEMDVGFVDVYRAWMDRTSDGVDLRALILPGLDHPAESGYKIIAEELMRFF
ncbi:MAG: SGNH/GDSL hydrolase family protein [Euryarchaeota archaeon]|nr:SGNH/GDSL hydrolase family protein [Euryarchaeota archaeon]